MTHQRLCRPQKQPCPSPYLCGTDCDYQTADTPLIQKNSDGSNPGYRHTLLDAPGNALDDFLAWWGALPFWKQVCFAIAAILACILTAFVVIGVLR